MFAAKIKLGWINDCFEGEDAIEIVQKMSVHQDFDCLIRMARMEETKKGQKEVDKLEEFVKKYYDGTLTMDDIKALDVHLSVGNIVCHGIAETEEEIETLRAK